MRNLMQAKDIPGISPHVDWGAGMIDKGIRGGRDYKEPCERALKVAERLIEHPTLLEAAWKTANVRGSASASVAALTLWLARGRKVHDGVDGVRGGTKVELQPEQLISIIRNVEKAIGFLKTDDLPKKRDTSILAENYIPNKEDFETAYRAIALPGEEVSIDAVLDQIEHNAKKAGHNLKKNWRMVTELNIRDFWSKK